MTFLRIALCTILTVTVAGCAQQSTGSKQAGVRLDREGKRHEQADPLNAGGKEQVMDEASESVEARNKRSVAAAFDHWREGVAGGVFDLLAADSTWTITGNSPVSRTYASRQEFLDVVIEPFNGRLARRLVPTVRGLYSDGDTVIALFDGEGIALDGKPYRNTYSWYMRFRDGKIVSVVAFFDTIEFTDFWKRVTPPASRP
jgi:ketosteroid isomerase-like protein